MASRLVPAVLLLSVSPALIAFAKEADVGIGLSEDFSPPRRVITFSCLRRVLEAHIRQ